MGGLCGGGRERTAPALIAALLLLLCACRSSEPAPDAPAATAPPARQRVEANDLGRVPPASVAAAQLRRRAGQLHASQRLATLEVLVARHPDVALEALRAASAGPTDGDLALARIYEQRVGRGWLAALETLRADPELAARNARLRTTLIEALSAGRFAAATGAPTIAGLPAPVGADTARLRAMAHLAAGQTAEADAALGRAIPLAAGDPQALAELQALRAITRRRGGDARTADASWQAAVAHGATLARRGLAVPRLWERLAYLRPHATPWPAAVAPALKRALGGDATLDDEGPEVALRAAIGQWRLRRGEPGAALLALKQAEASLPRRATPGAAKGDRPAALLRLNQARALAQLGQRGGAVALLLELEQQGTLRESALAVLGAISLAEGRADRALGLLRRAFVDSTSTDWPGRDQAEADYGLALLANDQRAGLDHLRRAARRFAARGATEQLVLCLRNELAYHESAGHGAEAEAVRRRLAEIERGR